MVTHISLVLTWFEELKAEVPGGQAKQADGPRGREASALPFLRTAVHAHVSETATAITRRLGDCTIPAVFTARFGFFPQTLFVGPIFALSGPCGDAGDDGRIAARWHPGKTT